MRPAFKSGKDKKQIIPHNHQKEVDMMGPNKTLNLFLPEK
jgi:hypothetical protein